MRPPLLFAVSTLGRLPPLERLLGSLDGQLGPEDRIAIVAQDHLDEVRALSERFRSVFGDRLRVDASARGASRGRNAAVALHADLPDDALVMFPNDTTWYPPGSVDAIASGVGDAPAGAVHVMTDIGPRFVLPPERTALDTRTVWRVIEMSLVLRLGLFRAVGGFDEDIGTGASTPWQAGEVTDLLLRVLGGRPELALSFAWIHDPSAHVGGVEETSGLTRAERTRKLRAYGRGIGHVYRSHPFPVWQRWGFVAAGALIGVRRGGEYAVRDGLTAFAGRWEGVTGRVRGNAPTAVRR
ncbi:glycosyltransferase family 2 protein [Microbacterium sp. P07]|uniref:glycosyltransferase family 2 protein n=1 Tax=Microbacterium sp. P07 TaxID=3366952 RepID=UPI0037465918